MDGGPSSSPRGPPETDLVPEAESDSDLVLSQLEPEMERECPEEIAQEPYRDPDFDLGLEKI